MRPDGTLTRVQPDGTFDWGATKTYALGTSDHRATIPLSGTFDRIFLITTWQPWPGCNQMVLWRGCNQMVLLTGVRPKPTRWVLPTIERLFPYPGTFDQWCDQCGVFPSKFSQPLPSHLILEKASKKSIIHQSRVSSPTFRYFLTEKHQKNRKIPVPIPVFRLIGDTATRCEWLQPLVPPVYASFSAKLRQYRKNSNSRLMATFLASRRTLPTSRIRNLWRTCARKDKILIEIQKVKTNRSNFEIEINNKKIRIKIFQSRT